MSKPSGKRDRLIGLSVQSLVKLRSPSLTVGLLNGPAAETLTRVSTRALPQHNKLWDFDGSRPIGEPNLDHSGKTALATVV